MIRYRKTLFGRAPKLTAVQKVEKNTPDSAPSGARFLIEFKVLSKLMV